MALPKFLMLQKSPALNRIFYRTYNHLVDVTEPICQDIDKNLSSMLLFDTSGIEAYVTENNPKYANRIIKQLKAYAKSQTLMTLMTLTRQPMPLCLHPPQLTMK